MPTYRIPLRQLWILVAVLLAGCGSDHDLKRDGNNILGGGYIDDEVRPGLYSIKAFSNISPFPTLGAARKTFEKRANTLCGAAGYTLVNSNLDAYQASGQVAPPRISFMAGHVLCANSGITVEQARKILFLD